MMITKKERVKKISKYIETANKWHEQDAPDITDHGVGFEMSELESEILKEFGLPEMAFKYSDIMQAYGFTVENIEENSLELYEKLKEEAGLFLLGPIENNFTLLKNAKENWIDAQDVLPFLKHDLIVYNYFIYQEIYCKGLCDEKGLLHFLNFSKNWNLNNKIKVPHNYKEINQKKTYTHFVNSNFPYLNEYKSYLKYQSLKEPWDFTVDNADLEEDPEMDEEIILNEFYITEIKFLNKDTCSLFITIIYEGKLISINIWCVPEFFLVILQSSKYFSLISHIYYTAKHAIIESQPFEYSVLKLNKKSIEITNVYMELTQMFDEDDEVNDPFVYTITYFRQSTIQQSNLDQGHNDLPF